MVKAEDLVKQQKEREDRKYITFDKIFKLVESKIIIASSGNNYYTWYQIPNFLVGLPLYSQSECKDYIIKRLNENGFKTELIGTNILYISWKSN